MKEFDTSYDYGFSGVSEKEYNAKIGQEVKRSTGEVKATYADKLSLLEKLIIPFLLKLRETGDKEYIYWPNRQGIIEDQINKILAITRE